MYDEPPDPEPNPCPHCDAEEVGYNANCPHCALVDEHGKLQAEFDKLKLRLANRVRILADQPLYADGEQANGVAPRFLMAAALLMELGDLNLELMSEAKAALLSEYGEWGGDREKDAARIEHWSEMQWRARGENLARTLPSDVLDRRGASFQDRLWVLHLLDGRKVVATEADKRRCSGAWSGGSSSPWNNTLREFIDDAFQSIERGVGHWVEFAAEYASPPTGAFEDDATVSYVVGDQAYTAHVGYYEPSMYGGTGFGGAPFLVRLEDGRQFFTNNNWARGVVPQWLRKTLRSNAVFADEATAREEMCKARGRQHD